MQRSFLSLPIPRYMPDMPVDSLPEDEDLSPMEPNKQLVQSVKKYGVLNPIVVQEDGPRLRLRYGNRRLKAARKAGLETVPVLIYSQGDELPADITIIENEHRSSNPVELYFQVKALAEKDMGEKEIAAQLGLAVTKVRPYIAMSRMDNVGAYERAWLAKQVSDGFIRSIAKRSKSEQMMALEVLEDNGKATLEDLKAIKREGARAAMASLEALSPSIFTDEDLPPYCTKAKAAGDGVELEVWENGERRDIKFPIAKILEWAKEIA